VNQQTQTPLAHALECAARGWAVFPVSQDKTPRTPNGHKAASTEPERIRAMHVQFGFVLIGIRTGEASNLAVLDIDRQNDGGKWWADNRHRLPATRTHRTRSGGLHLFFQHRAGLRCNAQRIALGTDIRAEGGYIIYWPAAGFPVLTDAPLADWPSWLAAPDESPPARSYKPSGPRPAEHIEAQLMALVRKVALAPQGQRNGLLWWASRKASVMIASGELSKPHAEGVLIEAARRAGLEERESARTIASGFKRGAA
jgi:hypothetical protein